MYCNGEAKNKWLHQLWLMSFLQEPPPTKSIKIWNRLFVLFRTECFLEITLAYPKKLLTRKNQSQNFFFSKAKALLKGPLVWPTLHPYIKARLFLRRHPIRCCGTVNACAEPGCRRADNHSDRIDPSCAHACIDSNYPAFSFHFFETALVI